MQRYYGQAELARDHGGRRHPVTLVELQPAPLREPPRREDHADATGIDRGTGVFQGFAGLGARSLVEAPLDRGDDALKLRKKAQDVRVRIDEQVGPYRGNRVIQHDPVRDSGRMVGNDQRRAVPWQVVESCNLQVSGKKACQMMHDPFGWPGVIEFAERDGPVVAQERHENATGQRGKM